MRGIKNRKGNKWKRIGVCIILLLILGVLTNSVRKVYNKKMEAQKTLARMEKEVEGLENRQEFLGASLQRLTTEEGIAFEMRKKLNVAQAGEKVAIIVEEKETATTTQTGTSSWQKVKNFFADLFR